MINDISSFMLSNYMSSINCASNPLPGYCDVQLYPSEITAISLISEHQQGYEPCLTTTMPIPNNSSFVSQSQPVVPSQLDMYQRHASMPSSPESAASFTFSESLPTSLSQRFQTDDYFLLPEFHQYSKETYENSNDSGTKKKRRCQNTNMDIPSELRRQVHIQSEQKRRAQVKDGFEELRLHLPGCANKKISKAALLHRAVQHVQHVKKNQASILMEIKRLIQENEALKTRQFWK